MVAPENAAPLAQPLLPGINSPPPLNMHENPAENWKYWKQMWGNYVTIADIEHRPAAFKKSVGAEALKFYNTMKFDHGEDPNDLQVIMAKIDMYIMGEKNESYEHYIFNERKQQDSETIDSYKILP